MKALASEVKELDETDNMKLPKRLKRNPILEAIAEVRFLSSVPNDAVIGLVFSSVQDIFGKPENLPILQLPAALREADPNLKYQLVTQTQSLEADFAAVIDREFWKLL